MSRKNVPKPSETGWDSIDRRRDEDMDTSDIPELDDSFFANAVIRLPEPKASVTLRIDREVLDWFKSQGKGYQTRINAVLKAYKEARSL
jgi:uncharacterized protein (DUF4415 family)